MDSFDIKPVVDRIADSGLLDDCDLEALSFFVDYGYSRWLATKIPRTDPLNELIHITCQNMLKEGREIQSYKDVIPELWKYENNVIDEIELGIIYWIDSKGRSREATFDNFRTRLYRIKKKLTDDKD